MGGGADDFNHHCLSDSSSDSPERFALPFCPFHSDTGGVRIRGQLAPVSLTLVDGMEAQRERISLH